MRGSSWQVEDPHPRPRPRPSSQAAITRSRKLVVLVGTLKALAIAVKNMDARRSVTLLKQRLQESLAFAGVSP